MSNLEIPKEYLGNHRLDILTSVEAAMLCAVAQASKSLDPSTQVGACLIDSEGRVLSSGCNAAPDGWDPKEFPWERNSKEIGEENTKYPYVTHAEINCLNNVRFSKEELSKMTLVVTLFPCSDCAKKIVASGIRNVIYLDDYYKDTKDNMCSRLLLSMTKVKCIPFSDLSDILSCDVKLDQKNKTDIKKRVRE